MRYLVSILAYGDCLITLSLIEQIKPAAPDFQILGTAITSKVSALLRTPLPVTELLDDRAAFYAIKEYGARKAFMDFFSLRAALKQRCGRNDLLAFERNDLRTRAVKPFGVPAILPPQTHRAYLDRQVLVRQLFGTVPEWAPTVRPRAAIRSVLINPCARFGNRWLAPEIVENVIAIAAQNDWTLTLLDPCGRYADYRHRVARYEHQSTLTDATALLKTSDLYIGPDSFFIHLAYYYRIPLFGFFFSHYHDFLAPGMAQLGNFTDFESARNRQHLEEKLMTFLQPGSRSSHTP